MIPKPMTHRRFRWCATAVGVLAVGVGAAGIARAADLADPSATTTTTQPSDLVAITTTTTTRPPTVTPPTTSTTTSTSTSTSTTEPPTAPPVVAPPAPPTTAAIADVAVVTIPPGEPGQLVTSATVPRQPAEPVSVGQWSTDPDDWSPEVREYLVAQGLDLDTLAGHATAGAGAPNQLLSNEGCAVNCITSGLAHAVGVGVYLEVTTSVPAFIQIEIVDVGLKFGPPSAQIWGNTWANLDPGTTYQAIARAHDAQGNMAVASGEFTTMVRAAQITFTPTVFWLGNSTSIDPFADHTWQLSAAAYLDGAEQASATGEPAVNEAVLATAAALTLTIDTGTIDDSQVHVTYAGEYRCLEGCGDTGGLDQAVPPHHDSAGDVFPGGSPKLFWGTVANGIELDGYPDDVTSWTGHEFSFPLSTFNGEDVGPPVYLTIDVTVTVSYDPPT